MKFLKFARDHFWKVMKDERGFLQALIPLATAAYGAYSSSKAKKDAVQPQTMDDRNPERRAVDSFLANYLQKYGSIYEPQKAYDGKFSAGMTGFENQGLDQFLAQYLNQPDVSGQTADARALLNKTINGGFDPRTSDYYKATRDEAEYNRNNAVTRTNADLGARGKFFSSEALNKYGDINAQTSIGLNKTIADLANQERNRSMAAIPQATALEEYISKIPLAKASAATSIGSIPRVLEQQDLERMYQDFIRRQDEGKGVISAGTGVSSRPTEQGYPLQPMQKQNPQTDQLVTTILSLLSRG